MTYRDAISEQLRDAVHSDPRTGREIAREAHIHEKTLYGWLGGRRGLCVESLERIAGVLGCEIVARIKKNLSP